MNISEPVKKHFFVIWGYFLVLRCSMLWRQVQECATPMLNDPAEDELGVHSTGLGQGLMIQESIFHRNISEI